MEEKILSLVTAPVFYKPKSNTINLLSVGTSVTITGDIKREGLISNKCC